jgi:hypothetical protein
MTQAAVQIMSPSTGSAIASILVSLVAIAFAATTLSAILGLRKGFKEGRFPKRTSYFQEMTDSDLDYSYRDQDWLGFWGSVHLHILFIALGAFATYSIFWHGVMRY